MNGRRNFTLLELIVVIAVAAMLVAAVGAAFDTMGGGTKVEAGANIVGNELNMAKSAAANRRRPVAVVFADRSVKGSSAACPFGAVRSGYIDFSTSPRTVTWLPNSEWTLLPRAVRVSYFNTPVNTASTVDDCRVTLAHSEDGGTPQTFDGAMVFTPRGTMRTLNASAPVALEVHVAECPDEDGADPSGDNFLKVKVSRYTGVVKYEEPTL